MTVKTVSADPVAVSRILGRAPDLIADFDAAVEEGGERVQARHFIDDVRQLIDGWTEGGGELVPTGQWRDATDRLGAVMALAGWQREAAEANVRYPIYNFSRSYDFNKVLPWLPAPARRPTETDRRWSIFGHSIGFPIGVSASALTGTVPQIASLGQNGFNVITFKTVRAAAHPANSYPNWVTLPEVTEPLSIGHEIPAGGLVGDVSGLVLPGSPNLSTANSFGVPSSDPLDWQAEVAQAHRLLAPDQLLIVSVMGPDEEVDELESVVDGWVRVAKLAQETGVSVIELNLSCPNTLATASSEGVLPPLCLNPELSSKVVRAVRRALRSDVALVAKISFLESTALAKLVSLIGPAVDGYAAINTLQLPVRNRLGGSMFGNRHSAGVSGIAIRDHALQTVRDLYRLRIELGLRYEILGMGGVTDVDSFEALYNAGASVVQSASGVVANRWLATETAAVLGDELGSSPRLTSPEEKQLVEAAITRLLSHGRLDQYAIASEMPIPVSQTEAALESLSLHDVIRQDRTRGGVNLYSLAG